MITSPPSNSGSLLRLGLSVLLLTGLPGCKGLFGPSKEKLAFEQVREHQLDGAYDRTEAACRAYLAEDGNSASLRITLARALHLQGRHDEAKRAFAEVLIRLPADGGDRQERFQVLKARILLSFLVGETEGTQQALEQAERARDAFPEHPNGWLMVGRWSSLLGRFEEAQLAIDEARAREVEPWMADYTQAALLEMRGRPTLAHSFWLEGSRRAPEYLVMGALRASHHGEGLELVRTRRPREPWQKVVRQFGLGEINGDALLAAAEAWRWKPRRQWRRSDAHLWIAATAEVGGDLGLAREHYRKVVEIDAQGVSDPLDARVRLDAIEGAEGADEQATSEGSAASREPPATSREGKRIRRPSERRAP